MNDENEKLVYERDIAGFKIRYLYNSVIVLLDPHLPQMQLLL